MHLVLWLKYWRLALEKIQYVENYDEIDKIKLYVYTKKKLVDVDLFGIIEVQCLRDEIFFALSSITLVVYGQ